MNYCTRCLLSILVVHFEAASTIPQVTLCLLDNYEQDVWLNSLNNLQKSGIIMSEGVSFERNSPGPSQHVCPSESPCEELRDQWSQALSVAIANYEHS